MKEVLNINTLVHTCEEVNDFMHFEEESIHLGRFATLPVIGNGEELKKDVERLLAIRSDVLKALEEARAEKVIGKSLQAHVYVNANEEDITLIQKYCGDKFNQYLIVSKVEFTNEECKQYEVIKAKVVAAQGHVCPRCWFVTDSEAEDGLCARCAEVLK